MITVKNRTSGPCISDSVSHFTVRNEVVDLVAFFASWMDPGGVIIFQKFGCHYI